MALQGGCCGRTVSGEVTSLSLSKLPQLFESEIFVFSLEGGDCCPVKLKVTVRFQNQRPDTVPLQIVGSSGQGNWILGKYPSCSKQVDPLGSCWLCTGWNDCRIEVGVNFITSRTTKKPVSKTNRTRVSESYLPFLWMVAHAS